MTHVANRLPLRVAAVSLLVTAVLSISLLAGGGQSAGAAPAQGQGQAQGRQAGPPPPPDPRVGLKAGVTDAGQAARGMELVASLPKAPGFEDPQGRGGLNFANSDLAFQGTLAIQGNFNGMNFFEIEDPRKPQLRTSVTCPGGQGDVSVYGHLLFMSVEETRGRIDCGVAPPAPPAAEPAPPPQPAPGVAQTPPTGAAAQAAGRGRGQLPPDPGRFRGVRIFDISNPSKPKQIAAVQTCRGSHTHTLVTNPKDKTRIYIYGQGTGQVRSGDELAGCSSQDPTVDPNTALFSIDIIEVPLATPEKARIVNRPRIFADPATGAISGLWQGGTHGAGTQTSSTTTACHDITAYPAIGLAAGACSGNGILLDISDPAHPVRLDDVVDPNFAYWHSASFNNDGTKVIFTDEWGGGTQARCRATDPLDWGADAIFTLVNKRLKFASYYKMPAAQTDTENCVAHNGSLVPVPGRDIKVQAWYQGGASMFDFTDPVHPVEIAYFDRGPIDATRIVIGGFWSTYWYNGYIYASEIARGLDILKLVPTEQLSQNEIDAANLVKFDELNVQSQPRIAWPASFVVARAYLDQLTRSNSLPTERADALRAAMTQLDGMPAGAARRDAADKLGLMAAQLDKDAATAKPIDAKRMRECAVTIKVKTSMLR
jgi:hypothetical protein